MGKKENPGITIVGGQSFRKEETRKSSNTNIEKILIRASLDKEFREILLKDRESAIEKSGVILSPVDDKIIKSIPLSGLKGMIEKFMDQKTSRRNFLKGAAASAAILTGAFLLNPSFASDAKSETTPTPGIKQETPSSDQEFTPLPDYPVVTKSIDSNGGVVDYDYTGLRLVIPGEALAKSVDIEIRVIQPSLEPPENVFFYGLIYYILPEDIEFSQDVSILLPLSGYSEGICAYLLRNGQWEQLSTGISEGYLIAKTRYSGVFASGFLLDKVPTPSVTRGMDIDY